MIPTTVSSSSTTSSPTTSTLAGNSQQNYSTAMIGIASLILEGRAISEDEFQQHQVALRGTQSAEQSAHKVDSEPFLHGSGSVGDRQSPVPSTSRAATRHMSNITTNPLVLGCVSVTTTGGSLFDDIFDDPSFAAAAESTHQRWTQKLCQLRQVSPASSMNRDGVVYEQKVGSDAGEPAHAINTESNRPDKEDFEVVRRVMNNRSSMSNSGGSTASSPGSTDNFLHSLQSLATTCLRGASPVVETGVDVSTTRHSMYRSTPPQCFHPFVHEVPGSASSSGSGIQSPLTGPWLPSTSVAGTCAYSSFRFSTHRHRENFSTSTTMMLKSPRESFTSNSTKESTSSSYPQLGPHCEQFLRKMGLGKVESADAEDHFCDMSYVNINCSRWRAYNLKMEAIIARGEPICIEVYLGPMGHKILLEQWILTQKDKVPPPTMTLPSLCSAIRSQLYFSQISAWCDLIKKSDNTIYDTGRVIFPTNMGTAGDLATTGTSPTSSSSSTSNNQGPGMASPTRRPRLNIFYRIKQYDSTASFNTKPHVHNFPSVVISEGCSLSVCLKSLPRINGGIPKLGTVALPIPVSLEKSQNPNVSASCADSGSTSTRESAFANLVSSIPPPIPQNLTSVRTAISTPKTSRNCDINKASITPDRAHPPSSTNTHSANNLSSPSSPRSHSTDKSKCKFFIDEEELRDDDVTNDDEEDCTNYSGCGDSSNSSFNSNLSHREKQLMKYRKRMLKRDKKSTRKPTSLATIESYEQVAASASDWQQRPKREDMNGVYYQPMDQGDDVDEKLAENYSQQRSLSPLKTGNDHFSISSPSSSIQSHPSGVVAMISTGTQTQMTCCHCGGEKVLLCPTCINSCDGPLVRTDDMDGLDSCSISSSEIIHTPRNKAELLLQAIQRTPKAVKKKKKKAMRNSPPPSGTIDICSSKNNNHTGQVAGSAGCQVCKRQKTQHNFSSSGDADCNDEEIQKAGVDEDSNDYDERLQQNTPKVVHQTSYVMDQESFVSSTKLTPQLNKCSLYNNGSVNNNLTVANTHIKISSPSSCNSLNEMKMDSIDNTATAEATVGSRQTSNCTPPSETILINCEDTPLAAQFKTPTNIVHQQKNQLHEYQRKQTPKPTLLKISATYNGGAGGDGIKLNGQDHYEETPPPHNALLLRKGLPKVNLTPIFCNPSATVSASTSYQGTLPIPISSCPVLRESKPVSKFSFENVDLATSTTAAMNTVVDNSSIPVQKSFSAPTLPNSPSLSPRFSKQAAIYKRRSRHLSERSDRSSMGSDEQFSDEELDNGIYSPVSSPMKMRSRTAGFFGRQSLLGNLEESLLQKRLVPKVDVVGFKVLLGASGGFCPTQLSIPAAAYFYELHGETLSTPYVCNIRLPRKGYSVPRAGTIQVTLLNPMGTVVRMFVIPYDMRDMPPLHQTFIRQRVLAEASINETIETSSSNYNLCQIDCDGGIENQSEDNQSESKMNNFDGSGGGVLKVDSNSTTNYNNSNCNTNINSNKYRLSPNGGLHGESNLGHFISAEHMKRLRYSIHLRFQTSRSGRLSLHTDIRLLISRRTDCDTAAAHAKGVLEAPNDLVTDTVMPSNPKYSARQENPSKI